MAPWLFVLVSLSSSLAAAAILGLWHLRLRHAAIEQTLYGQPGEPGLVEKVNNLRPFVHDRVDAALVAIAEVDEKVHALELLIPQRRSVR